MTIQRASSAPVPGSCFSMVGSDIRTIEPSMAAISEPIKVLLKTVHL